MRLVFPQIFDRRRSETSVQLWRRKYLFFILYACRMVVLRWSPSLQDEKAKVVEAAAAAAAARHEHQIGGRVHLF